jgi:LmbE family N-acetylglucosaminyl deacetylase
MTAQSKATVVTFHAHPDDEAILSGGTIARLAAEGHRVVLVVATRGELGEVPEGLLAPGQDLAHRRTAETRWAAEVLGVARVEFLGYHDSGMAGSPTNLAPDAFCQADVDEAGVRLASIVREERADVLLVYDDHGAYGHPDHVQVHRVGMRAAELVPEVAVYEATINRDHVRRGRQRRAERLGEDAVDVPDFGPDFGVPESAITHAVDVRPYAAVKRRAMAAHSSQISETSFFLALPEPAFVSGFGMEWYVCARPAGSGRRTVMDELADA